MSLCPWYAVTIFVPKARLAEAVDHFRAVGGASVSVSDAGYIFYEESRAYRALVQALGLE